MATIKKSLFYTLLVSSGLTGFWLLGNEYGFHHGKKFQLEEDVKKLEDIALNLKKTKYKDSKNVKQLRPYYELSPNDIKRVKYFQDDLHNAARILKDSMPNLDNTYK